MSRMSTTCPNCKLHLAVTPSDLRVGQGYVRCGRCQRVFNALLSLEEDLELPEEDAPVAAGTGSVPALDTPPAAPAPSQPDTEPSELSLLLDPVPPPEPTDEPAPNPEDTSSSGEIVELTLLPSVPDDVDVVESLGTGTFETIILEGHGVLQTEEHVEAERLDEELQHFAERLEADRGSPLRIFEPPVQEASEAEAVEPAEPVELLEEPPSERTHWIWAAAVALLALLLLAQLVHHYRYRLASSWAGGLVGGIYSATGNALEPDWDLKGYDLRQLGAESPSWARDQIIVRASVLNRARHPQPPPVIRVVLQDRFGNALGTHDVLPQDYLRTKAPARLAPDQRLDAEMVLADPGSKAAGFELDACLPSADGPLHCAGAK